MTNGQRSIKLYLEQNHKAGSYKAEPIGDDELLIREEEGVERVLSLNLHGDIMEKQPNGQFEIIARSDLPHDLLKIGYQLPSKWEKIEK